MPENDKQRQAKVSPSNFRSGGENTAKRADLIGKKLVCCGPKLSEALEKQKIPISLPLDVAQPKVKEWAFPEGKLSDDEVIAQKYYLIRNFGYVQST